MAMAILWISSFIILSELLANVIALAFPVVLTVAVILNLPPASLNRLACLLHERCTFWRVALAARFWAWPVWLSDGVPEFEVVVTAFVVVAVVCIDERVAEGVTVDDVVLAASVLAD